MDLKYKIEEIQLAKDCGRVPLSGKCELRGTNPFLLKIKGKEFRLDSRIVNFSESSMQVEGLLGDDEGVIARCLISFE